MKTVVITGASAGIGAAIARRLGREGNQLALAARRVASAFLPLRPREAAGDNRARRDSR